MDKQEILSAMRAGAAAPRVHFWAALMAGPAMEGAKCVPEELWGRLGEALASQAGDFDRVKDLAEGEGFRYHENHARGEAHEAWQSELFGKLVARAEREGAALWFVPCDELVCLHEGADDVCDFVSISRLSFKGSEDRLRAAVDSLCLSLSRL